MHTLTKIKLFRIMLYISYPFALLLYPFALLRKKNKSHLFFFFDRYVIGGAQRVHLDILKSVADVPKQLYFTRKSENSLFKDEFYALPNTDIKDIHKWCENLLIRLFSVHFYAFYINSHKKALVFSSNSTFFYDMLPFLNKRVIKTELLHSFFKHTKGPEFFGLGTYKYLDRRVVVDSNTFASIGKQYEEYKVPASYMERVSIISPGVIIPGHMVKHYDLPLKVLYAGRGTYEKRVHLLDAIAQQCIARQLPIEFHFAGNMIDQLSDVVKQNSVLHGEIHSPEVMYSVYRQCHVILLTSIIEGFPMLIKEGMACGCIPVVTALEGNKTHLSHQENSLLIFNIIDEDALVQEAIGHLEMLAEDTVFLKLLSQRVYSYAVTHFNIEIFSIAYREFLMN